MSEPVSLLYNFGNEFNVNVEQGNKMLNTHRVTGVKTSVVSLSKVSSDP